MAKHDAIQTIYKLAHQLNTTCSQRELIDKLSEIELQYIKSGSMDVIPKMLRALIAVAK